MFIQFMLILLGYRANVNTEHGNKNLTWNSYRRSFKITEKSSSGCVYILDSLSEVFEQTASEIGENYRLGRLHCRLMPLPQEPLRTSAYILYSYN